MNTGRAARVDLKEAVKNLDALPAIPVIGQKLLALDLSSDAGEDEMLVLISQDPQISAKAIGMANSAAFGASRKITSVKDAAMVLGLKRLKSVAISLAIMSDTSRDIGRLNANNLWMHHWSVAFAMLAICHAMPRKQRPNDDQAFLVGMLHDIGYVALACLDVESSDELCTQMAIHPGKITLDMEREMIGITHDELGAVLARSWKLPEEISDAILLHHSCREAELDFTSSHSESGMLLAHLANLAERVLPALESNEFVDEGVTPEEWAGIGIEEDRISEVCDLANEQAAQAGVIVSSFLA